MTAWLTEAAVDGWLGVAGMWVCQLETSKEADKQRTSSGQAAERNG
jgi:hypothetical protein